MPTADQLAQFVGQSSANDDQLDAVIGIVTSMIRAYTRGAGFTDGVPAEDVEAVILTSAARLLANPSQLAHRDQMAAFEAQISGGWIGFTLVELAVLNRYRERAV